MSMDYNTSREFLTIREYGRNVQNLIYHMKSLEDKEQKNKLARLIIEIMGQLNPAQKTNPEYHVKLWNHLVKIADYDIADLELPEGVIIIRPEETSMTIERVPYPQQKIDYRHYGKNIEHLIDAAKEMEGDKQKALVKIIASYMKTAYRNWNNHDSMSDDAIISDLESISGNTLTIDREEIASSYRPPVRRKTSSNSGGPRGRNNSNNNNRRRTNNNNTRRDR